MISAAPKGEGRAPRARPITPCYIGGRSSISLDDLKDSDEIASIIRVLAVDYERAREMNLPEPTWLPEKTLQWYARAVGIARKPRLVEPSHVRIRIRRMRRVRKLTQAQLGRNVGLSQAAISYIETGKRSVRLAQLCMLAEALGVGLEWLVRPPEE